VEVLAGSRLELLDRNGTLAELISAARSVFEADLDAGHVTVLTEMISGAQSVPGLGERVAACLATSDAPATGRSSLMDWIAGHGTELGRVYANELDRHYRPTGT
jgi:hypothetical protein